MVTAISNSVRSLSASHGISRWNASQAATWPSFIQADGAPSRAVGGSPRLRKREGFFRSAPVILALADGSRRAGILPQHFNCGAERKCPHRLWPQNLGTFAPPLGLTPFSGVIIATLRSVGRSIAHTASTLTLYRLCAANRSATSAPHYSGDQCADRTLKDPLIYYFAMLGKRFGMRQARIWLTFALVKPPDLTDGVCASPCNLIARDRLTY